jgi:hypothetical protein
MLPPLVEHKQLTLVTTHHDQRSSRTIAPVTRDVDIYAFNHARVVAVDLEPVQSGLLLYIGISTHSYILNICHFDISRLYI